MNRRRNHRLQARRNAIILLVDDAADTQERHANCLEAAGFEVQTASNGEAAARIALALRPDAVITDLRLRNLDGVELTRRLKSDYRTAHIPIIACTSYVFGGAVERALDAGCDAFLVKPCGAEDLLNELRSVLAASTVRRTA